MELSDPALAQIATYFQALAEPTRLKLLNTLRKGEVSVGELTLAAGCSQANVSKHLALLARSGMVDRRQVGTTVYYGIADPAIFTLCDLVCGQIADRLDGHAQLRRHLKRAAGARAA